MPPHEKFFFRRWLRVCRGAPFPLRPCRIRRRHISWLKVYLCKHGSRPLLSRRKSCTFACLRMDCRDVPDHLPLPRSFYMCRPFLVSFLALRQAVISLLIWVENSESQGYTRQDTSTDIMLVSSIVKQRRQPKRELRE